MGNATSTLPDSQLERLKIESGLSRKGIRMLHNRFISLAKKLDKERNEQFMDRQDFENIRELQMNPLGSRIIDAFFADAA